MPHKKAESAVPTAEAFYKDVLVILNDSSIPYLVGGTFALQAYTGISRPTKDIDIFCKASDYPKIMSVFKNLGYRTQATDERWLARVKSDKFFFDIIFNSANGVVMVQDSWFNRSKKMLIFDTSAPILSPTDFIWSKMFIQNRYKYDGSDVVHMMLIKHKEIDWKQLLSYSEQYWEMLLIHILNFRFVYPSERERVPRWLLNELISRLNSQIELPTQKAKICRGRLLSRDDYEIDIKEWKFEDYVALS